jgi:D-amino-acid dehydrogenase
MKIAVIGAGIVGVSTAYELTRQGHSVTVFERHGSVGEETSFANAGQISPGYSSPWAAPGVPLKAVKWLFQRHAPLAIRPDGTLFQLRWLTMMLAQCTQSRYAINKERMLRLAEYSRDCLIALRADLDIPYEGRQLGTLQVFRSQAQRLAIDKDVQVLRAAGVPFELLEPGELARVEPALAAVAGDLTGKHRLHENNAARKDNQAAHSRVRVYCPEFA